MNIYFCGIGGVGLGPLAEIAVDAGYTVVGSDPKESLMTQQMRDRGVDINADQSGAFLQSMHDARPIDWFVYTSALPANHPELVLAESIGIKTSKRDELLAHIIEEKGLKLIAVAGTHGKTGTTAMAVWAFKQLGIPISYSIGTTLSFGPSGQFNVDSKYFIYECDEYDRNFLSFHPFLALITALSYDHPDTYPSQQEYDDAFTQFARQSQSSILWQKDANQLGQLENAWTLGEHDVRDFKLVGTHYRENASLVAKAFEKLEINDDITEILNRYPGVDRRFEKLADNIYTDYAIHPKEIDATLKLARELNDDIVLVYQPHQNVRQYAVQAEYADTFKLANDIYWLPTYLTREDPTLAVLTSQQLTQDIVNQGAVHIAEFDDELWENVQRARDRGALVLFMGAGSIDGWVRDQLAIDHAAGVLLIDTNKDIVLQSRDDKPDVARAGMLAAFGGGTEPYDTSQLVAAVRELKEETNISFEQSDLHYLTMIKMNHEDGTPAYTSYYVLNNVNTDRLEVYEGQGYKIVNPQNLDGYPLTPRIKVAIGHYLKQYATN